MHCDDHLTREDVAVVATLDVAAVVVVHDESLVERLRTTPLRSVHTIVGIRPVERDAVRPIAVPARENKILTSKINTHTRT